MKKEILPIGSVVVLEDSNIKFMIVALKVILKDNKIFDYAAVRIPKGFESNDKLFMFNSKKISKVIFEGYKDDQVIDYLDDIKWLDERMKSNEK